MKSFDCIIIGAGSIGCCTAYYLAKEGLKVLCIDKNSAAGQGQNKSAIGGIRATHSHPAKIKICLESIEVYKNWEAETGIDIEWKKGGYCYPIYTEKDEQTIKSILPVQKEFGLNIDWVNPEKLKELVPGINSEKLRGGTFSPDDGLVSPLRSAQAFTDEAIRLGATFNFDELVTDLIIENDKIKGIKTNREKYSSDIVINAAGANAKMIGKFAGLELPIESDSHEAGISAPVRYFLDPLVVDIRPGIKGKTENFYFAQLKTGQIIFCYTPKDKFFGTNRFSTSEFLPIVSQRIVQLMPRLKNLTIRRIWRGLYPMTPDGTGIVDKAPNITGFYLGVGMCGQGLMMAPGVGRNLANLVVNDKPLMNKDIFKLLSAKRDFKQSSEEKLK